MAISNLSLSMKTSIFICIARKLLVCSRKRSSLCMLMLILNLGGDASMELTMAAQEDDTPWSLPSDSIEADSHNQQTETVLRGRGYFSELGIVRRKPSRPDAPPTLSKSCSDKLALKQCTSLLSSPVSLLISPENAYLTSVTLPEAQYSATGCERAFSPTGRMAPVRDRRWKGGYRYQPFQFRTTSTEFSFSRRCSGPEKLVPSNISAVWTPYGEETLIGGVLQGRKQFDVRGASMISKRSMWKLALEVSALLAMPMISRALSCATYKEVKLSKLLEGRRKVKEDAKERALKGWVANWGNDFGLEAECLGHNSISQPP
jgi:tRNA-specific adenosine deaminase 1